MKTLKQIIKDNLKAYGLRDCQSCTVEISLDDLASDILTEIYQLFEEIKQ